MTTTTIRLSDKLKVRVVAAAERVGTSAHNFMLQAVAEKTAQEELRGDFNEVADSRYAEIVATGMAIPWDEMRGYLEGTLSDGAGQLRPVARKLAG